MSARLEKQPRKAGFVIKIKDGSLNIDSSFQTNTQKKRVAEKTASILNANLLKTRRGELRVKESWSTRDKIYFLINEAEAPHLSPDPITLIDAVDKYILSRLDNRNAYNTVQLYKIHLQNAVEFFGAKTALDRIAKRDVREWVLDQCKKKITNGKHRGDRVSTKTVDKRVNRIEADAQVARL